LFRKVDSWLDFSRASEAARCDDMTLAISKACSAAVAAPSHRAWRVQAPMHRLGRRLPLQPSMHCRLRPGRRQQNQGLAASACNVLAAADQFTAAFRRPRGGRPVFEEHRVMASWQAWKNRLSVALFLGFVSIQAAAADPMLSLAATPDPAVYGSPVGLDVLITGAADLYAFQFTLSFDPAVLQASAVTEGPFLAAAGSTFFVPGAIDNALGSISYVSNSLIGAVPGASGNGVLAHISLDTASVGVSALTFSDVIFLDSSLADINVQVDNRILQVVPESSTLTLMLAGIALVGLATSRRRKAD
jgi:hypothetical protein